jgi:hypothetical protein
VILSVQSDFGRASTLAIGHKANALLRLKVAPSTITDVLITRASTMGEQQHIENVTEYSGTLLQSLRHNLSQVSYYMHYFNVVTLHDANDKANEKKSPSGEPYFKRSRAFDQGSWSNSGFVSDYSVAGRHLDGMWKESGCVRQERVKLNGV